MTEVWRLAVLVTALSTTAMAAAQETSPIPAGALIAFVSPQRILQESTEGKAKAARLQAFQQEKAAELRTRQQALETTLKSIAATSDPMRRTQLERDSQTQRADLEKAGAQMQVDFQNLQRTVNAELQVSVKAVLDELLKGSSIQTVLSAETAVVWGAPKLDLTNAVIQRMNAKSAPAIKR